MSKVVQCQRCGKSLREDAPYRMAAHEEGYCASCYATLTEWIIRTASGYSVAPSTVE